MLRHLPPLFLFLVLTPLLHAQGDRVYADRIPVKIEPASNGLAFDSDHSAVALGRNGDMLVVWHAKNAAGQATEIQAAYFTFEDHKNGPRWEPSDTIVLAGLDAQGRRCLRPDIVLTYDSSSQDFEKDAFVVVWARAQNGTANGKIEAARIQAPSGKGKSPKVTFSDGRAGFPLDNDVDTNLANATPDIAWHPLMGNGRFGVVYSHLQSDDQNGHAEVTVRWREVRLPSSGSANVFIGTPLATGVKLEGALYDFAGGAVAPDAVLLPSTGTSLNLVLGFEESTQIRGVPGAGSHTRIKGFHVIPGGTPTLLSEGLVPPNPGAQENLVRRPMLSWNRVPSNRNTVQLAVHVVDGEIGAVHRSRSYTLLMGSQNLVLDPWVSGFSKQRAPAVAALSSSHILVFHDEGMINFAFGNSGGLHDGPVDLGIGALPAIDLLEGVGPGGRDLVAIVSHDPSGNGGTSSGRIWVRLILENL